MPRGIPNKKKVNVYVDEDENKKINENIKETKMEGKHWFLIVVVAGLLLFLGLGPQIIETVPAGSYQICQNVVTGDLKAQMKPGPYGQWFGHVYEYPAATTFFFTNDKEGGPGDTSIEVQFYDGSKCRISGTCRIEYPKTGDKLVSLLQDHGFRSEEDLEQKLILPVVRRALTMSSNMITAKESYAEKRTEFINDAWDQIQNGVYLANDEEVKIKDVMSGQEVTRLKKVKKLSKTGEIMRDKNPLEGLDIRLANFEIKKFVYDPIVDAQIKTQQEAMMSVQTAKAKAQAAEQDQITAEATGKANVMKAQYEKETLKAQAIVEAKQKKEVAETQANQEKEVAVIGAEKLVAVATQNQKTAEIQLKIADLEKQAKILQAEGESTYKQKLFMADGGLLPKLEAFEKINKDWADAFKERKTPQIVSGGKSGSAGSDNDALSFMELLTAKTAKDLAVDMSITKGFVPPVATPATK